ncbi:iron-containing alcohol dehydrogenase family protein [Listeria sp. FSL L7-1509]|uniref:Iron-containing alcohol dehydrogenase family protein n=1 Tax=Listeria immobilis TaxID=2713502 RepID=A0ABR6SYN6_9LIST|nr:iron-containing alcohol dehydrogenase family protein [Listeria immobilis]MBC1483381.1 iron-containing alcohol dehydrogenase family protein [Listeria immobilis]MBC1507638.1 iron-containing alcohol dehydrogenase family protein [Listeria immobilis]MBC1510503.1 iron-containing alcohol dehydrogenase family protein [Listeria immobilis]MBC6303636.1 iron-containing alcohol dehydrogenase family protein [Listeria immobilis]MBC6312985.1 iron-containing alcohol dehydrogenase family protein [Listeria im
MLNKELIVRGAPQEYLCQVGAWDTLPNHLERRGLENVLIVRGNASWEVAKKKFPKLPAITSTFETYNGTSTYEERDRLVAIMKANKMDAIIAVGGGKVADVSKAAAAVLRLPVIILPTLASTCAAYTPLSVMYDSEGAMIRYDVFASSNALLLIDPEMILDSPKELLVAGIGDTLAKWYEADVIIQSLPMKSVEIEIAHFAAKMCHDNLLNFSEEALLAMDKQELNEAFIKIIETNILVGGMVGGFGDDYGRCAGAHSIHDALTMVPETHHLLHGNKVAYGILVQLVIENRWDEIEQLLPFYTKLGLPASLYDMGLASLSEETLMAVSERATEEHETIHMMPGEMTPIVVLNAIKQLEESMAAKRVTK